MPQVIGPRERLVGPRAHRRAALCKTRGVPVLELLSPGSRLPGTWAGGTTHEVARWGEPWRARLSVATIARAAPFTALPGRRRWLAVLDDGGGLVLHLAGERRALRTGDHLAFAGDLPVQAEPGPRPARVWNAMATADVALAGEVLAAPAETRVAAGVVAVHAAVDVVVVVAAQPCPVAADHTLLVASSTPTALALAGPPPGPVVWTWLGVEPRVARGRPPVTVVVRGPALRDVAGFHAEAARAFGFPPWYGANLDAWLDCLTSLDEPEAGLSAVHAPPGGVVSLVVEDADRADPAVLALVVDGVALVNERRRELGLGPVLALAYRR